ncbi:MAG: hypothetical protein ACQSGP_28265 [Frankia sp.]
MRGWSRRRTSRTLVALASGAATVAGLGLTNVTASRAAIPTVVESAAAGCQLGNGISHVIQIQFDNVHLTRDNPRVPSDLEQMPHLLSFLTHNGTVLSNDHDVLVHTATNFTSNQTGLYEDRTSVTQSNSYSYYDPTGATHTGVSFAYWTDPIYDPTGVAADTKYTMNYSANPAGNPTETNIDTPAPWVPYTRAGCNVGDVGMANTVLENIATDIPTVFGANSPEAAEATADPTRATADFVGLGVHCARTTGQCATGQTDSLPDEPGGYSGYRALFGNAEIAPVISPGGPVANLTGATITDGKGHNGFPGFDSLTPDNSLAYAADMQEHGVPVTNIYVSDVHGDHSSADTGDLGPGEQTYEQQLKDYDTAFASFLTRLAKDGITPANTLFSVTTDEGDHFSGNAPTPASCTGGAGNYCGYATRSEVNVNLPGLLATQDGDTTPFAIHSDPAPAVWVQGNPARTAPTVRSLEREVGALKVTNPLTGAVDRVANQLADPVEEKILHFVGPDAARTPTFTAFSGEDEYVGGGATNCTRACVYTSSGFAWNHGGIWPDMADIWSAYVGPGVQHRGTDPVTWTDQTDTRPTVLALVGLRDDYPVDGRVLIEDLDPRALPDTLRSQPALVALGAAYKQIEAADGTFAKDTLTASTRALNSGTSAQDATYTTIETALGALDSRRDHLAETIRNDLLGAAFNRHALDSRQAAALTVTAQALLHDAHTLARAQ